MYPRGNEALVARVVERALSEVSLTTTRQSIGEGRTNLLTRPLALIIVAAEEVNKIGMRRLVSEQWSETQCSHVLHEGGFGVKELHFEEQDVVATSVGEKGVLWIKFIA